MANHTLHATHTQAGMRVVAHAGEEGPAQYVWDALNLLGVARIDNGVKSVEDSKLMMLLAEKQARTLSP